MPLSIGDKLGPYEILAPIGAGGMGEVYRARDPRLGRDVAIKILQDKFSDRFNREARAVAALNHSNVCTLFDVGPNYLVMELIEGPTLADRIKQASIPLEEALAIAKQIAEALDAAHQNGIVHRDLKPANIKVSENGNVKVLDFGLAKRTDGPVADPENSPTMTTPTGAGMIIGTAAYMSPEQARGKIVDKRTDIWAFGVVLYEMVTGRRAFQGEDLTETLASVVKDEPRLDQAPAKVRRLLRNCLQKDPKRRLRDIGDAWELIEEPPIPFVRGRWVWGISGLVVAMLAVVAVEGWLRPVSDRQSIALEIMPPAGVVLPEVGNQVSAPEISPDGSAVMYLARDGIYVRRLDSLEPKAVLGSSAASGAPFWSADSATVMVPARSQLMKTRMPDGAPEVIAPLGVPFSRGGSWSDSGKILMAANGLRTGSDLGGELRSVEMPAALKDGTYFYPEFLPASDDFLFVFVPSRNPDDAAIFLATLRDGKVVDPGLLLKNQTAARYTPAGGGRILFVRNDNLYSQKLNRSSRKLVGQPELVVTGVASQPSMGVHRADFSVARNGTIAWRPGRAALSLITIFDRQGKSMGTVGPPGSYTDLILSPEEDQLLVGSDRTWLMDVGKTGRLALPGDDVEWIGWSADRSMLVGVSDTEFVAVSASGSGGIHTLRKFDFHASGLLGLSDISDDGRVVLAQGSPGILTLHVEGTPIEIAPRVLVEKDEEPFGPRFSPDGRWFVYESRESGGGLYVRPIAGPGPRRQIAPAGMKAAWRKDGKEIVFLSRLGLMSVTVNGAPSELHFGAPQVLFSGLRLPAGENGSSRPLAVSRDGSRIFLPQGVEQPDSNVIHIKTGWIK